MRFAKLLFFMTALLACASAHALRCGSNLVDTGFTKAEVYAKCGEPAWSTGWTEYLIDQPSSVLERRISIARELWIYDLGPQQFLRILRFTNGTLTDIDSGDYGTARSCALDDLSAGITQYEVERRCGAPFFRDSREEEVLLSHDRSRSRLVSRHVEEWTYNLGPHRFMRILVFANGMLVSSRSGERGF